jgi:Phage head-tail joining protein.
VIGAHELNRTFGVWRTTTADDGAGGQSTVTVQVGTVRALVSQPPAAERMVADQSGARLAAIVHMAPGEDVRRGDELRGDGETLRVLAVVRPSESVYLRAECERVQSEGT